MEKFFKNDMIIKHLTKMTNKHIMQETGLTLHTVLLLKKDKNHFFNSRTLVTITRYIKKHCNLEENNINVSEFVDDLPGKLKKRKEVKEANKDNDRARRRKAYRAKKAKKAKSSIKDDL